MLRVKADQRTAYRQAAPFEPVRADFVACATIAAIPGGSEEEDRLRR